MSICDNCIHDDVCGLEDNHEEGIVSCADMIPKNVLEKIRAEILLVDKTVKDVRTDGHCFFTADEIIGIIDKHIGERSEE